MTPMLMTAVPANSGARTDAGDHPIPQRLLDQPQARRELDVARRGRERCPAEVRKRPFAPAAGVLQPLRELGALVSGFSERMAYCDLQKFFDSLIPFARHRCYWKSHYLADLPDALIDECLVHAAQAPSSKTLSSIWNFRGATADVAADDTAFGDRSMPWMYSIDAIWTDPTEDDANIAWARSVWQSARQYTQDGRIYLNFAGHGEDGEPLVRRAYGANYGRLAATKAKYDPRNAFRFNENIRPAT